MLDEVQIVCPYCWEDISVLLDLSIPAQEYIEDCQVCCQPIGIAYNSEDGILTSVEASRTDS